jgi:hypothetical protein
MYFLLLNIQVDAIICDTLFIQEVPNMQIIHCNPVIYIHGCVFYNIYVQFYISI